MRKYAPKLLGFGRPDNISIIKASNGACIAVFDLRFAKTLKSVVENAKYWDGSGIIRIDEVKYMQINLIENAY